MKSTKNRHYLGAIYTKVCPWGDHEFQTDSKQKVYCSPRHYDNAMKARQRERKYQSRETIVSSKPGASYRLTVLPEERVGAALIARLPEKPAGHRTEVVLQGKAPVQVLVDYQLDPRFFNLVRPEATGCVHGYEDYCVFCDFR